MKSNSEPSPGGGNASFPEPIAIVGMGGVFPGAPSLAEFWRLIEAGPRHLPPGAGRAAGCWIRRRIQKQPCPARPTRSSPNRGCFIEDPSLDGELDPMFQLLLRAGQAAFADARTENLERGEVGVVLGNIALPTAARFRARATKSSLPLFEQKVFGRDAKQARARDATR